MNTKVFGEYSYTSIFKHITLGALIGLFLSIVLMLVFAIFINYAMPDPDTVMPAFIIAAAVIGAFTAGYYAARKNRSRGLICGLSSGGIICMILILLMLFYSRAGDEQVSVAFRFAIIICNLLLSCAGGIAGNNRKKTSIKRRSKK